MMSKTQISLDPEVLARARRRARDMGISLAEYIRRLVDRDLGERRPARDVSVVFGLGASGGSDIAREKDAALAGAVAKRHRRGRP